MQCLYVNDYPAYGLIPAVTLVSADLFCRVNKDYYYYHYYYYY